MNADDLSDGQVQAIAELFEAAHAELLDRRGGPELLVEIFGEAPRWTSEATRAHLAGLATEIVTLSAERFQDALGLISIDGITGHLSVYVRPEARSRGVGSELFAKTLSEARRLGAQRFDVLVLPGDRPMKQVCEKAGLKARKLTMALSDAPLEPGGEAAAAES